METLLINKKRMRLSPEVKKILYCFKGYCNACIKDNEDYIDLCPKQKCKVDFIIKKYFTNCDC